MLRIINESSYKREDEILWIKCLLTLYESKKTYFGDSNLQVANLVKLFELEETTHRRAQNSLRFNWEPEKEDALRSYLWELRYGQNEEEPRLVVTLKNKTRIYVDINTVTYKYNNNV